jgi:hypothetical protein
MELLLNKNWTECYGNAYIAEAIACQACVESRNHDQKARSEMSTTLRLVCIAVRVPNRSPTATPERKRNE